MTQNIEERAKINTFRSVSAMIAIGIINIITVPFIAALGRGNDRQGYLLVAVVYGCIFAACHIFCFAKTKEVVKVPEKEKISLKVQLSSAAKNKPYMIAVVGQFLFGVTLYGRNADALYYFTYVEGNQALFSTYSLFIIIPSIIGAACFPVVFRMTNNKGRSASIFALLTGNSMFCMYFFTAAGSPVPFYLFSCLTQFFFSGFNTAIYAIGTSVLAGVLGSLGYMANQQQNPAVLAVMKHSFTTVPGILWIVTAGVLYFYRLNRKAYNKIVQEIQERKESAKHV